MADRSNTADRETRRLSDPLGVCPVKLGRERGFNSRGIDPMAPEVMTITGRVSHRNTIDLAIWPTVQPTAAAASAAVRVPAGNSTIVSGCPAATSAARTRSIEPPPISLSTIYIPVALGAAYRLNKIRAKEEQVAWGQTRRQNGTRDRTGSSSGQSPSSNTCPLGKGGRGSNPRERTTRSSR
jgi:hypothetical protein